jgi:hypothetical protein
VRLIFENGLDWTGFAREGILFGGISGKRRFESGRKAAWGIGSDAEKLAWLGRSALKAFRGTVVWQEKGQ